MIQDLEFGGDLIVAMEQITRATNPSTELEAELAAQYKSEGKLKPVGKWLRDRLQPSFRWVSRRPRWAEDEGHWAFVGSSPMCFLGQAHTTEENTHEGVPSGEMLYLFFQKLATGFEFKVVSQGCGEQTAEAQHKLEALISDFERQRGSTAAANVLVRKGDKWAHLFLLERADVQPEILKLLAKKGATREIKEQAAEKLKAA